MTTHRTLFVRLFSLSIVALASASLWAADPPKPIKALLVTGGCCHDYTTQKNLIKEGLEARAHIEVTVVQQGGSTTNTKIPLYQDPKWADGYDIVLHDECFAGIDDPAWTARVLKPHQEGLPGVVIHCAMHCYRDKTDQWFRFCGVTSHKHGAHYPHTVYNYDAEHPIMQGFGPAWYNPQGELYHIAKVWDTAHVLGASKEKNEGTEQPCVWTNQYGDARIFGTTLGHHNETVEDDKFLALLTRGTLWACDKLSDEYLKEVGSNGGPQMVPVNLALNRPAKASSEEKSKNNFAGNAVDGNKGTRWCAAGSNYPQWLEVDLGEPKDLRGAQIDWESANSIYRYTIDGSADGETWKTIVDASKNQGSNYDHEFVTGGFRYIRVNALGCRQGGWASIRELRLLGTEMVKVDPIATLEQKEAEKLGQVRIPEGFEKTLFAAPPAVNYPVFVAASPEGDVYVSVDKNGSLDRELKRGAIHRLRDTDGDGRADEVKLFVPDVDSPRGLVWDRDRLYVLHPPHLSAFIDDDGDGRSDRQEILIKNLAFTFKDRPADHTSNGVTLGIDGWLYLAIGDFGFMEAEGADGRKLQLRGGGVVRVRPDGSNMEVYSNGTRNILEVAMDPLLNGFTRDNTNDGGGWDIRLHHFSGLEDHGYPRLYMNFDEEIVQPLADYGGGSGCGTLYMDEPGFPKGYGDALYTADWGRSWIFRHNPQRKGATFEANQEEFLGMPRVTDLDVDAESHIYAASWAGATFTYNGEDVGYLVRVTPKGYESKPMPNLLEADTDTLIELLRSDSHRRRLAAQRELLARGLDDDTVAKIQAKEITDPKVLVATIYLMTQGLANSDANTMMAINSAGEVNTNSDVRANATRALADVVVLHPDNRDARAVLEQTIDLELASNDPRRQLEAIIAVARTDMKSKAPLLLKYLGSDDSVLRHTAFRALAKMEAYASLFEVIDEEPADSLQRQFALIAIQRIHRPVVVNGLIKRLQSETSAQSRQGLLVALCRLYNVDGEWKGNSWGTRPDTRGPYYQPEKWEQSDKIGAVLSDTLASAAPEESVFLLKELRRNRVKLDGTLQMALNKANNDPQFAAAAVMSIAQSGDLPSEAIELLSKLATAEDTEAVVRAQAVTSLLRSTQKEVIETAFRGLTMLHRSEANEGLFKGTMDSLQNKDQLSRQIGVLDALAKTPDAAGAVYSEAGLLFLSSQEKLSPEVASTVKSSLDAGWNDPARQVNLLYAAQIINDRKLEGKVIALLDSSNAQVAAAASELADVWKLKAQMSQPTGPKVGTIDPAEVIKMVVGMKGDKTRGEALFAKLTCNKCHTVNPDETPRGPYLPQVAKTYKRDQLTESIVLPSKSLAQGFVTNIFQMDDGRLLSGFITFEGPDKIVIRDNQGNEITLDPEAIEGQKKDNISVMPVGLANEATVQELADLVTYLESLAAKAGTK